VHVRSRDTTASPEQVWRLWSDTSTWPRWNPDVVSVSLNGPFAAGATGTMRTKAGGQHAIRLASVQPGGGFALETAPVPLSTFTFNCRIAPGSNGGSRISQAVSMRGPLGWLFSAMMGERIADSFGPLLDGLARQAEATSRG
jgi:hypothetical protein